MCVVGNSALTPTYNGFVGGFLFLWNFLNVSRLALRVMTLGSASSKQTVPVDSSNRYLYTTLSKQLVLLTLYWMKKSVNWVRFPDRMIFP